MSRKAKAGKQAPAKKRGLKVRRVPDTSALAEIRSDHAKSLDQLKRREPTPAEGFYKKMPSVGETLSVEQRALQEAGDLAELLLKETGFKRVFDLMVGLRQAYAVAYRELQEQVAKVQETWPEGRDFPLVEDFLIQYATYQAGKPFNEHQLMRTFADTILPGIATIVDQHVADDAREAAQERMDQDKQRRERPVPIGCKHTPVEGEEPVLAKGVSLTLVGWKNAVLWVLDQICAHVLANPQPQAQGGPFTTVRFLETAPKSREQHRDLIRLGGKAWAGCANSNKTLARCMGAYVADSLSAQPDLVIVDHLPAAHTLGFTGRDMGARAGDAHRWLRRWCDSAGAALIGAVCLPDAEPVDIASPAYEQLRTFTLLRFLTVTEGGENEEGETLLKYRISLGAHATYWDVDKSVIDAYVGSELALPAGVLSS